MKSKIVKLQKRSTDFVVSIPVLAHKELEDVEYMKCNVDETGIHYTKVEID